jgi:hypothetical protein
MKTIVLVTFVLTAVAAGTAYFVSEDDKAWKRYAAERCKVIGRTGSVVPFVPVLEGYSCDDGLIYWRRTF